MHPLQADVVALEGVRIQFRPRPPEVVDGGQEDDARIVDAQLEAVDRLQSKDFDGTLLRFVDRILASPRQGGPRVAFDFWHQFDALEQLQETRMFRPSAYMALPEEPA